MSKRDYWVSFRAEPREAPQAHPAGLVVSTTLRERLVEQGLQCAPVENWRDSGFSIDCDIEGRTVYCFVSRIRTPNEWIVCCTFDRGVVARFFGKDKAGQLRKLVQAVAEGLRRDDRFDEIKWYPDGWEGKGTERWSTDPFAAGEPTP